jgi:hypothetical protein
MQAPVSSSATLRMQPSVSMKELQTGHLIIAHAGVKVQRSDISEISISDIF